MSNNGDSLDTSERGDKDKNKRTSEQFTTNVTGGFVGYIVNAARGAVVTIRTSIFGDVKQVIVFFSIIILVGSTIGYFVWLTRQPHIAHPDDFYIAVAEFEQIPAKPDPEIAPVVSQLIFDYLDTQYQLQDFDINVIVEHKNIGHIEGGNEAKELANKINADFVIFGTVTVTGSSVSITPKFYVAETIRPDISELTGTHQLTLPIVSSIEDPSEIEVELRNRSEILIDFTKSLTNLTAYIKSANAYNLKLASESIQSSIQTTEQYGQLDDSEVLYLFASHISRLSGNIEDSQIYVDQALSINPDYGRAFIAKANIYYDQLDFDNALKYYEAALDAKNQPANYRLYEKAHLGIGDIYTYQFQIAPPEGKEALAEKAFFHLNKVINSYLEEKKSRASKECQKDVRKNSNECKENIRISELAALAYYSSGIIYQHQQKLDQACGSFQTADEITVSEDLIKLSESHIEIIDCPTDNGQPPRQDEK